MPAVLPNGKQQYFGNDGLFLNGGLLYTYQAGTLTPKPTYQDPDATVENTNPVVLDERGEAVIFWTGSYDITLADALDNIIYSVPGLSEPTAEYRTSETGSAIIPAGATSQRDDPAQPGYFRFNVETNMFEGYVDAEWKSFQELLVSGVNLKTINTASLLDAGDINLPVTMKTIVHADDTPITQDYLSTIVAFFGLVGDINQSFGAAATYEDGFWFIARNQSEFLVTLVPDDTPIDGLGGYVMYPNESRLFYFNAADGAFNSIVMSSFSYRFEASGSFIKPPGYTDFDTVAQGPGGGAGGGEGRAAGSARGGGAGGGGGSKVIRRIPESALAATSAVAVGAGGVGGNGGVLAVGSSGVAGGLTSITSSGVVLSAAYSGGPGMGGVPGTAIVGGSGAGVAGPGAVGVATGTVGGLPANANIGGSSASVVNNWGGGGAGNSSSAVGNAEYGGASGGSAASAGAATLAGGGSIHAAGGGGCGSGLTAANVASVSTRGGSSMTYSGGTGGVSGANGANGIGGTNGVADGEGGGGAGSGSAGVGGQGGAGAKGGGGGGGGGGTGAAGGQGGNGGDGYFDIKGVM